MNEMSIPAISKYRQHARRISRTGSESVEATAAMSSVSGAAVFPPTPRLESRDSQTQRQTGAPSASCKLPAARAVSPARTCRVVNAAKR